ncbi:Hypothetical predicted protein [Mytilus galloprovincialis]|uniref:Uncharacterized protein n=1 Tax=Mytilus galloprovincialis TaxID=29158 RepID=A0A8B6DV66_MYTGA|nr:Hypothetical predicted protein [Mytilus galloprovincialis]
MYLYACFFFSSTSNPRKEVFLFYKIESPLSNFYAARFEVSGKWYTIVQSNSTYTKKPFSSDKTLKRNLKATYPKILAESSLWT